MVHELFSILIAKDDIITKAEKVVDRILGLDLKAEAGSKVWWLWHDFLSTINNQFFCEELNAELAADIVDKITWLLISVHHTPDARFVRVGVR